MPGSKLAATGEGKVHTERLSTPFFDCDWEVLNEKEVEAGKPMRVAGRFQHADVKNGNGRIYPLGLWEKTFKDEDVTNRLQHRRMLGELEHPADGQTNLNRVSHLITGMELREDGEVYGEVEVLNTPAGKIAQELFRHGVTVGISSRGRGSSYPRTGAQGETEEVVDDDYVLETFDLVYNPSTPDAFLTRLESKPGSLPPEAQEIVRSIAKGILKEESPSGSSKPDERQNKNMKNLKERLAKLIKRASDIGTLVSTCEAAELSRFEDETLDMMVEAEDAVIQQPALKPIVEHCKVKLGEVKNAIENRLDGSADRLDEEVTKHLNADGGDITEDRKSGGGEVDMITVPAELFRNLHESNSRNRERVRDLSEARANASKTFVTRERYETAMRLTNKVIAKGRGFKGMAESASRRDAATTQLLEQFIEVTDRRQVKLESGRVMKMFSSLKPFRETLLECVSAKHVRQTANKLLRGIKESRVGKPVTRKRKPKGPGSLTEGKRTRRPSKPRLKVEPKEESGSLNESDRGLAIAARASEKLGWKT